MRLDRAWIEEHIPHHGRMCLLDEVIGWDEGRISCRSNTHRAVDNPLRAHGRLGIACGVEYAAQAMAVHGALIAAAAPAASAPVAGFLASVRGVRLHVLRLDDLQGDLICSAVRVAGDRGTALYEFELKFEAQCLLSGRATVVLDANGRLHL
jgi:predicted hotdog family 3-hydroxylacyl-ACP dehydratase